MKYKIVFFIKIQLLWTCKSHNPELKPEFHQGCCGTKSVEFFIKNAKIYIPNVFTPNGDGINDVFYPHFNEDIVNIESFTILTPGNDTTLFYSRGIDLKDPKKFAWDGVNYDNRADFGKPYIGKFNYALAIVAKDGTGFIKSLINGEGCVIRCNKAAKIFKTKEGCYYSEQVGENSILDKTKSNKENSCF